MIKFLFLVALVAVLTAPTAEATNDEVLAVENVGKPIGRCPMKDIPNKPPRFLPDAEDCRRYYECSGGKTIPRLCPEGQCFTRKAKGCE